MLNLLFSYKGDDKLTHAVPHSKVRTLKTVKPHGNSIPKVEIRYLDEYDNMKVATSIESATTLTNRYNKLMRGG